MNMKMKTEAFQVHIQQRHYWVETDSCRHWCYRCGTVLLSDAGRRRFVPMRSYAHVRLADGSSMITPTFEEPPCNLDPLLWRIDTPNA